MDPNPTVFVEYIGPVVYVTQAGIALGTLVIGGLVLAAKWKITRVWGPCADHPDGWAEEEEIELE